MSGSHLQAAAAAAEVPEELELFAPQFHKHSGLAAVMRMNDGRAARDSQRVKCPMCVWHLVVWPAKSTTASSRGRSFPFLRALSSSDGSRSHAARSSTGLAAAIPAAITAGPTRAAERPTPPPVAATTFAAAVAAARVSVWLGWHSVHWDGSPLASVFPAAHPR